MGHVVERHHSRHRTGNLLLALTAIIFFDLGAHFLERATLPFDELRATLQLYSNHKACFVRMKW